VLDEPTEPLRGHAQRGGGRCKSRGLANLVGDEDHRRNDDAQSGKLP